MARTGWAAQPPITFVALADAFKAGLLFDVEYVDRLRPQVTSHGLFGLQVPEPGQTHRLWPAARAGKRFSQGFGNPLHGAALIAQSCDLVLLLWMERPPLFATSTSSIHQCP